MQLLTLIRAIPPLHDEYFELLIVILEQNAKRIPASTLVAFLAFRIIFEQFTRIRLTVLSGICKFFWFIA
jgi:hypothetical protein